MIKKLQLVGEVSHYAIMLTLYHYSTYAKNETLFLLKILLSIVFYKIYSKYINQKNKFKIKNTFLQQKRK